MTTRYLAYIALLAGWICFCYWLYAEGISPRLHGPREKSWPEYSEQIPFPLAFSWASDVPLAGLGYGAFRTQFDDLDSTDQILVITGLFFRDEAPGTLELQDLGYRRINNALRYLAVNKGRMMTEVSVQEITADVRSNPFEAIRFERLDVNDVLQMKDDTLEICFPLKDSLILPQVCSERIEKWIGNAARYKQGLVHIVGTADGSGIAESADIALDRAMMIKNYLQIPDGRRSNYNFLPGNETTPLPSEIVVLLFILSKV